MTWSLTLIYVCKSPAKIMVKKTKERNIQNITTLYRISFRYRSFREKNPTNKHHDMFMNQL